MTEDQLAALQTDYHAAVQKIRQLTEIVAQEIAQTPIFRWEPGMVGLDPDGCVWRVTAEDEYTRAETPSEYGWPDLADPPTCDCLLLWYMHLVNVGEATPAKRYLRDGDGVAPSLGDAIRHVVRETHFEHGRRAWIGLEAWRQCWHCRPVRWSMAHRRRERSCELGRRR